MQSIEELIKAAEIEIEKEERAIIEAYVDAIEKLSENCDPGLA